MINEQLIIEKTAALCQYINSQNLEITKLQSKIEACKSNEQWQEARRNIMIRSHQIGIRIYEETLKTYREFQATIPCLLNDPDIVTKIAMVEADLVLEKQQLAKYLL